MPKGNDRDDSLIACAACQTMKVKCDRTTSDDGICTRCRKVGRNCLSVQRYRSRKMASKGGFGERREAKAATNTSDVDFVSSISRSSNNVFDYLNLHHNGVDGKHNLEPLYTSFLRNNNLYLPFIDSSRPFELAHASSPLSLCSMCYVSARVSPDHLEIAKSLETILTQELSKVMLQTPATLNSGLDLVQSLLIFALWPATHDALAQDPSWLYAGQAVTLAYQMGLHKPFDAEAYSPYDKDTGWRQIESWRAWLGCYMVNVLVATAKGHPILIKNDPLIDCICNGTESRIAVAPGLLRALIITRFMQQQQTRAVINESQASVKILEHCIISEAADSLRLHLVHASSWQAAMFLYAQLQAHSQVLTHNSTDSDQIQVIGNAFPLCAQLINLIDRLRSTPEFEVLPRANSLDAWLCHAALFVYSVTQSRFSQYIDLPAAEVLMTTAETIFESIVDRFDTKAAKCRSILKGLRMMGQYTVKSGRLEGLIVSTRYGTQIFYHYLKQYRLWRDTAPPSDDLADLFAEFLPADSRGETNFDATLFLSIF